VCTGVYCSVYMHLSARSAGNERSRMTQIISTNIHKLTQNGKCFMNIHVTVLIYTVIHNYGNPYEKWNIFVAWPHLWLKLGIVKPEIMLCETMLNLSTLRYVTAQYPVT